MTKRTTGSVLLAALAALLAITGCGSSDPAPKALPPVHSASPAPSATASATVEAQVEAAVRHYFAVANEALATGDTTALKTLSSGNCPCRDLVHQIDSAYEHGGEIAGARFTVESIRVHDITENALAAAEIKARVSEYQTRNGKSQVIENSRGGQLHADFSLARKGGTWLVVQSVDLSA